LIAIFATSLLFYIAAIILWKQNTIDCAIVLHFNYVYENDVILRFFNMLSHYGMPFITGLYVLFLFLSFKNDGIYYAKFENEKYQAPVKINTGLPDHPTTGYSYISPDESYLIFQSRVNGGFGTN